MRRWTGVATETAERHHRSARRVPEPRSELQSASASPRLTPRSLSAFPCGKALVQVPGAEAQNPADGNIELAAARQRHERADRAACVACAREQHHVGAGAKREPGPVRREG